MSPNHHSQAELVLTIPHVDVAPQSAVGEQPVVVQLLAPAPPLNTRKAEVFPQHFQRIYAALALTIPHIDVAPQGAIREQPVVVQHQLLTDSIGEDDSVVPCIGGEIMDAALVDLWGARGRVWKCVERLSCGGSKGDDVRKCGGCDVCEWLGR